MRVRTFEELVAGDPRVRRFSPMGLLTAHETAPAYALQYVQAIVADCDLGPDVPDAVREFFERVRELHVCGYFAYGFFSVAFAQAHLAVELALKVCFVSHHQGRIPLVERQTGAAAELVVDDYAGLDEAFRGDGPFGQYRHYQPSAKKGWDLRGYPGFNASLNALFEWAIAENHLAGRQIGVVAEALRRLRNLVAHPTGSMTVMPPDSANAIRSAAEVINCLWGAAPIGGSADTEPAARLYAVRLAHDPDDLSRLSCPAEEAHTVGPDERDGRWFLIQAAGDDEAMFWDPDFELTTYPVAIVWSGGTWNEAVAALAQHRTGGLAPEAVRWRGRWFAVRSNGVQHESCRSPQHLRALAPEVRDIASWHWSLLRADHPGDVLDYLDVGHPTPMSPDERKKRFGVELVGEFGTWVEVVQAVDATP